MRKILIILSYHYQALGTEICSCFNLELKSKIKLLNISLILSFSYEFYMNPVFSNIWYLLRFIPSFIFKVLSFGFSW